MSASDDVSSSDDDALWMDGMNVEDKTWFRAGEVMNMAADLREAAPVFDKKDPDQVNELWERFRARLRDRKCQARQRERAKAEAARAEAEAEEERREMEVRMLLWTEPTKFVRIMTARKRQAAAARRAAAAAAAAETTAPVLQALLATSRVSCTFHGLVEAPAVPRQAPTGLYTFAPSVPFPPRRRAAATSPERPRKKQR
jgi:hypothetical protein